jgi:hypothetical protein
MILKYQLNNHKNEMFRPTPQKMAWLCYVTLVTGHKAYTGKEEEEQQQLLRLAQSVGVYTMVTVHL